MRKKNNTKSVVAGIRGNHISQAISSGASITIQAGRSLRPPKNRGGGRNQLVYFHDLVGSLDSQKSY